MFEITKPTLLLDKSICIRNIERMAGRARAAGLSFRPHCKTHQSHEIASWFRDFGVSRITVSSFDMAEYFIRDGWTDILVAFPFNPLEIKRLNEMSSRCNMSILADSTAAIQSLQRLEARVGLYIDVDPGYGRTGIPSGQFQQIEEIIAESLKNPDVAFYGFYCHAGHSYKAGNRTEQDKIHNQAISDLSDLKQHFAALDPRVLYGDTPNCSVQENFEGVDEITPGNFVFYDLMQARIGSCQESDIAVAMVCPVVGRYADSQQVVIHGGAVHFSKEILNINGQSIFGKLLNYRPPGWTTRQESTYLTALSQEHGRVKMEPEAWENIRLGELLAFHPVHSCLTANLMRNYTTLEGSLISMR
jgi:D-serine deaminase-like pyridoxal phosphate-dependent protein